MTITCAPTTTFTVSVKLDGSGTVTSSPGGINCGTQCSYAFPIGKTISLSASPATGWAFNGWTGLCVGTAVCAIPDLASDTAVTAHFEQLPGPNSVAYIAGEHSLIRVDLVGRTAATITSMPLPDMIQPIAITPDGARAYVTSPVAAAVTPVDLARGLTGTALHVELARGIAITPDGKTAYVTGYASSIEMGTVVPIDVATGVIGTPILIGGLPFGIAITADGRTAYVANHAGQSVVPIDIRTNTAGSPLLIPGASPRSVVVLSDGTIFATSDSSTRLVRIDGLSHGASAVALPFDAVPYSIAASPDGRAVYVGGGGMVAKLLPTGAPLGSVTIESGSDVTGLAFSDDGTTGYAALLSPARLTSFNALTLAKGWSVSLPDFAMGLALVP